jgi:hypothetical protein
MRSADYHSSSDEEESKLMHVLDLIAKGLDGAVQ